MVPYSGKLSREKTFAFRYKTRILWRKLLWIAPVPIIMQVRAQNFVEKTLTDGSETAKNAMKVFSLESFPLYVTFKRILV